MQQEQNISHLPAAQWICLLTMAVPRAVVVMEANSLQALIASPCYYNVEYSINMLII